MLVSPSQAQGAQATSSTPDPSSPVLIESVTLTSLDRPQAPEVVSLPVRSYRPQRVLEGFEATANFSLPAGFVQNNWVVFAEHLQDGGSVSVNGIEIGSVPTNTADFTYRHLRPFLFDIPPSVLKEGNNTLVRQWKARESQLMLSRMALGPKLFIEPLYERRYFWRHTMAMVSLVFASVIALILLGLYWQNRSMPQYLWVGASAMGWGILNLAYFSTPIPSALYAYWQLAVHCGIAAFSIGGNLYLLKDCDASTKRFWQFSRAWTGIFLIAYLINYAISGSTYLQTYTTVWHFGLAASGLYPIAILVRSIFKTRRLRHAAYLLITVATGTAGALDAATISGNWISAPTGYLLQTVAPIWFVGICFALITDFTRSLRAQQAQQKYLTDQLALQKEELNRLHEQASAVQEKEAAIAERTRIMQDMHDGLGSQLVSSLAMAQSGDLSAVQTYDLLRSCIDDLRLAIDTATDSRDPLSLALGNLRFRMEPRLKAAGITLRWNTLNLSDTLPLPPQAQLPLLRIIQESITNTLKHAHAKTLTVQVSSTATELQINIADDGRGFEVSAARQSAQGKGLNSLEKRARVLGASLELLSSPDGTQTLLRLPLTLATPTSGSIK